MVHHRDDVDELRMLNEEDAVWKAMNDCSTDETTHARKLFRASLDLFQLGLDCSHELNTQAGTLFLMPPKRFSKIVQRLSSENDW